MRHPDIGIIAEIDSCIQSSATTAIAPTAVLWNQLYTKRWIWESKESVRYFKTTI